MINSTSLRQQCLRAQGTLRLRTSLGSYIRHYHAHLMPRTGLGHSRNLSPGHSFSPRCAASATATDEVLIEETSTTLPSHWVDHLAHLRPGERRALNRYIPLVSQVSALEPAMQKLSDEQLAACTQKFRARIASGESLESLLPEAFAAVREAAFRVLGMRHYDVQILGGIVLAQGQVAEMATGEGKTLVAALPAYLYALSGKGVHIVTVNDYLAQRDASWIGKILIFLGLSVGVVTSDCGDVERKQGFSADVTYITAYELAFTFLQDNLAPSTDAVSLRRPLHYAIVDEVDSILIDEARNPFIMTFPDDDGSTAYVDRYWKSASQVARLLEGPTPDQLDEDWSDMGVPSEPLDFDFLPDYRSRVATLTQRGMGRAVRALAMPGIDQIVLAQLENGNNNTSATNDGLYVVLMAPTSDGTFELTIRAASGPGAVIEGESKSLLFSDNKEDISLLDGKRVVVNSRAEVDSVLASQFKLQSLPFLSKISEDQWRAAAPAALWTGGDHAWGRYLNQAIRAEHLYYKDVHYIVKDGEVVIVDTATGRERQRSRWQNGLHQAVEAKEQANGVEIKSEHYDKGRTTYQSLFNLYNKLCGMTGTAVTESEEFSEAYGVSVVRVPPHRPSKRVDNAPAVYMGKQGWEKRIGEIVRSAAAARRPVLLGTSSVEESEAVLDLVVKIPFASELNAMDMKRLETALAVLPDSLPPPDIPFYDDDDENNDEKSSQMQLTPEQQIALRSYLDLMEMYEGALYHAKRLRRSGRLTPETGSDIERAGKLLRALVTSDLMLPNESMECMEASDVLLQLVNRSRLGNAVPINLLNARPDRARKEAQIIAQAGLPGIITVATAMAGRGTDILLGGNPKGLTLIALQHYFLPILAPNADDLGENLPDAAPLKGLSKAFLTEADMKLHLPIPLYRAFVQAKQAAQEAAHQVVASSKKSGGAVAAAAGGAPLLPGYGPSTNERSTANGSTPTTPTISSQDVSDLLSKLLESVEVDRSVFLLNIRRNNQTPSLEAALEWTLSDHSLIAETTPGSTITPTERALRRYALLQWLWFDTECEKYATEVRAAGGLATIITSIQDTRRTERQLRGRAGRQGDPGETHMISHRGDPAVQSILSPAQMQGLWAAVEAQTSPEDLVDSALMRVVLKTLTTTAEQQGLSARELTRKYDAAIDSYRRHVFRLRRILAGGGDDARGVLAHRQLRKLASELVLVYADAGKHPKYWNVGELLSAVQKLFMNTSGAENFEIESTNNLEALQIVTGISQGSLNNNNNSTSSASSAEYELGFLVEMDTVSSAAVLQEALCRNWDLPCPQFSSSSTDSSSSVEHKLEEVQGEWMPVRRRVAFQNARNHQITSQKNTKQQQEQIESGAGGEFSSYKGRYAPAVARLQLWMGDLLTLLYERKRRSLATSVYNRCNSTAPLNTQFSSTTTTTTTTTTPLHVLSMLRLWERDSMLHCIDALWTDFLQDITTLQRAAMTRAFSQLDPVDEFKLEAAAVFSRLLRDFRRQSAVALLQPVDIRDLQWTMYNLLSQQQENSSSGGGVDMVLDDVAWLADTMEEERKNEKIESTFLENTGAKTITASNGSSNGVSTKSESTGASSSPSPGELAAIEKLLSRLSQASSEDLSAAIKKLDEKWGNAEQ